MIKQIKKFLVVFIASIFLIIPTHAATIGENAIISINKVSDVVENKSVIEEQMQICNTLDSIISENKVETNTQQEVYSNGWTKTRVNVRKEPNINSTILTTFDTNTKIEYVKFNNEWIKIKYKDNIIAYMAKEFIIFEQEENNNNSETLNEKNGVFYGPTGKETYYNLPMNKVISYMKDLGYDEEYWIREDGVKMYGEYIIIAANTNIYSKGTVLKTSLGLGIVCDHCKASEKNHNQIDIAVNWG